LPNIETCLVGTEHVSTSLLTLAKIGLSVLGIIVLVNVLFWMYGIWSIISVVYEIVYGFAGDAIDFFESIPELFSEVFDEIGGVFDSIAEIVHDIVDQIGERITDLFYGLVEAINDAMSGIPPLTGGGDEDKCCLMGVCIPCPFGKRVDG
jgi:phage-related protein